MRFRSALRFLAHFLIVGGKVLLKYAKINCKYLLIYTREFAFKYVDILIKTHYNVSVVYYIFRNC